jgi:hypothetical protein
VSHVVEAHFTRHLALARQQGQSELAHAPDALAAEAIVDAAFWASLRREEASTPKISLAFLPPEQATQPLMLERKLPLGPAALTRLAPAVERPGIHLGVWRNGDGLHVWGATRTIPMLCFVLEVVEPGLLVIKYRRGEGAGKYGNVAVLEGNQLKVVAADGAYTSECPTLVTSLLGFDSVSAGDGVNVLARLGISMRDHRHGGSLLVIPHGTRQWQDSIVYPIPYSVVPPFSRLRELMRQDVAERGTSSWQEAFRSAIEGVAGLTAVDGAMVISDQYELLAFGAKIRRPEGSAPVEQVRVTEPVIGATPTIGHPSQLGGTRHLSAAQFVHDQRDALALVASQDGRFTVFAWSTCESMVEAHRVETLLL